jgi:hypothetical protein
MKINHKKYNFGRAWRRKVSFQVPIYREEKSCNLFNVFGYTDFSLHFASFEKIYCHTVTEFGVKHIGTEQGEFRPKYNLSRRGRSSNKEL